MGLTACPAFDRAMPAAASRRASWPGLKLKDLQPVGNKGSDGLGG